MPVIRIFALKSPGPTAKIYPTPGSQQRNAKRPANL